MKKKSDPSDPPDQFEAFGSIELFESSANEAELLDVLTERIGQMLEQQPDYLMSLLYRLDVLEPKIRVAMHPAAPEPAHRGLARLVLERQLQRMATKRNIKPKPLEDMDEWVW
jgi:hypothetical protein